MTDTHTHDVLDRLAATGRREVYGVIRLKDGCLVLDITDGETCELPTWTGIAVISREVAGQRREPEVVVWADEPTVQLAPPNGRPDQRTLILHRTGGGQALRLTARVAADVRLTVLTARPEDAEAGIARLVWPDRVVRIAAPTGGRGHTIARYPAAPVAADLWPLVRAVQGHDIADGNVSWRISFVGDVVRELSIPLTAHDRFNDIGMEHGFPIAVWPNRILPGFRLYSLLLGDLQGHEKYLSAEVSAGHRLEARVYIGGPAELPGRAMLGESIRDHVGQLSVILPTDAGLSGPRFLALSCAGRGASGVFELLKAAAPAAPVHTIHQSLDFGTSSTTFAQRQRDPNNEDRHISVVLDMAKGDHAEPLVIAGNTGDNRLITRRPWLPTVPTRSFGGASTSLEQLPTGLFRYSASSDSVDWTQGVPFGDYTLVGSEFEPDPVFPDWAYERRLKWEDEQGPTRAFIETLLTWTIAQTHSAGSMVSLVATFPLRFGAKRRATYRDLLVSACQRVTALTGRRIDVILRQGELYADESTALIRQTDVFIDHAGRLPLMVALDLGGGTLEQTFAMISGAEHRILAADSVAIGANVLLEYLRESTTSGTGGQTPESDLSKDWRVLALGGVIRRQQLSSVLAAGLRDKSEWPKTELAVAWKTGSALKATQDARATGQFYFAMLAEHCARFIAGTLLDSASMKFRLAHGPGRAAFDGIDTAEVLSRPIAVAVQLSGNGWRFLARQPGETALGGFSVGRWIGRLQARVLELLGDAGRTGPIDIAWPNTGIQSKALTVIGALDLVAHYGDGGVVDPEAAPNGFDDRATDKDEIPPNWFVQVGPGSLAAALNDFPNVPPEITFFRRAPAQVQPPCTPAIPAPAELMPGSVNAQELMKHHFVGQGRGTCKPDHDRIRAAQANGAESRNTPTSRALFEEVVVPFVRGKR